MEDSKFFKGFLENIIDDKDEIDEREEGELKATIRRKTFSG